MRSPLYLSGVLARFLYGIFLQDSLKDFLVSDVHFTFSSHFTSPHTISTTEVFPAFSVWGLVTNQSSASSVFPLWYVAVTSIPVLSSSSTVPFSVSPVYLAVIAVTLSSASSLLSSEASVCPAESFAPEAVPLSVWDFDVPPVSEEPPFDTAPITSSAAKTTTIQNQTRL